MRRISICRQAAMVSEMTLTSSWFWILVCISWISSSWISLHLLMFRLKWQKKRRKNRDLIIYLLAQQKKNDCIMIDKILSTIDPIFISINKTVEEDKRNRQVRRTRIIYIFFCQFKNFSNQNCNTFNFINVTEKWNKHVPIIIVTRIYQ